jgi:hypothetical protein
VTSDEGTRGKTAIKTAIGRHGLDALTLTVYDESNRTNNVGSRLASM